MQWTALFGLILIVTAQYFSNLPFSIYAKSEFWVDSPGRNQGTTFFVSFPGQGV